MRAGSAHDHIRHEITIDITEGRDTTARKVVIVEGACGTADFLQSAHAARK